MIRRKKLLRLGIKPEIHKTREQKLYEAMVAEALENNKKRKKDKKYQAEKKEIAKQKYYESFPNTPFKDPNPGWLNGIGAKKTIFDAVSLKDVDLETVNAKRKELNIDTPIEQAALEAIIEAKRKAKQVAPLYNKGGYQYVSEKEVKDIGKKTSEVE